MDNDALKKENETKDEIIRNVNTGFKRLDKDFKDGVETFEEAFKKQYNRT